MNTIDLINKLAVNHNITTGRAEMIVSIMVERLVEKLKKDGDVKIINFGTFSIRRKEPNSGSYMKMNEPIPMSRNHVSFYPDKYFLDNINSQ
jgi:DNA-binding protein HU-beta